MAERRAHKYLHRNPMLWLYIAVGIVAISAAVFAALIHRVQHERSSYPAPYYSSGAWIDLLRNNETVAYVDFTLRFPRVARYGSQMIALKWEFDDDIQVIDSVCGDCTLSPGYEVDYISCLLRDEDIEVLIPQGPEYYAEYVNSPRQRIARHALKRACANNVFSAPVLTHASYPTRLAFVAEFDRLWLVVRWVGLGVMGFSVIVITWNLRRRHRRYRNDECYHCGYPMVAGKADIKLLCPECGATRTKLPSAS